MTLNFKKGKTEAMVFTPASIRGTARQATSLPPLKSGDITVSWTAEYRYLGYTLRYNLDTDHIIKHKDDMHWGAFQKIHRRTAIARRSSTAEQIQLTNTHQQGHLTYCLSLLDISKDQFKQMD